MFSPIIQSLRRVGRIAWLPVPVLLAAVVLLWVADLQASHEFPLLLLALNFVCSVLASAAIAWLVGKSFLERPAAGYLLMGCGIIAWGAGGMVAVVFGIAGTFGRPADINLLITAHNLCVLLSGICILSGTIFSLRFSRDLRPARLWLAAGYLAAACAAELIAASAIAHWTPVFFIQGQGGTPVRHFVLGSSAAMFLLSSLLLRTGGRGPLSPFVRWYSLALALVAIGLFGIMVETVHASLLSWTGRAAQFLGGIYMLVAALALVCGPGAVGLAMGPASPRRRYPYGVAVAIVAASVAMRLLFLQGLEANYFLTFYPAVMLAALYGGLGAGLLATGLSAVLAAYLFIPPAGHLHVDTPANAVALGIFAASCTMISLITEAMLHAQVRNRTLALKIEAETERQKFASLAEQSPEFIGMCDMEFKPFYVNDAALRLVGIEDMDQIRRTPITDFFFPEDRAFVTGEFLPRVVREGRAEVEIRFRHFRTGAAIWMIYNVFPIRDEADRMTGYATVSRDITERKRMEDALRASNDELARFNSAAVGRELRMVELKREINALCASASQPARYDQEFE